MLRIIDFDGRHYPIEGTTTLEEQLSSDEKLTVNIPFTENNSKFIDQVRTKWRIKGVKGFDDDTEYVVDFLNKTTVGKSPKLELKCSLYGIEMMRNERYYDYHDTGYSLDSVLKAVFKDISLNYSIVDDYDHNITMESFGDGQSVLEIFKEALELWQMEFIIVGKTVQIYKYVVRKPDYILHDNINAKNVTIEEDGTNFVTYVRAYGDINEGEPLKTAGVQYTYKHPLADVPFIGKKEAPPIKLINNDNTSPSASVIRGQLEQMCKDLVDNSQKITVTADFLALKDYPEAYPRIADEITLKATNLKYETVVRLIGITTTRTSKGEVINQTVTFGDEPLRKRHASNINFAAQFIQQLQENKTKISSDMLDSAVQVATRLLLNVRTELKFTDANGIIAVNKNNSDEVVVFNSAGLGISDDGGQTFKNAITGAGIVADYITSGTLNTKLITIEGTTGAFSISGDKFSAIDPSNPKKFVEIVPGQITIGGGGLTVFRPDGVTSLTNGLLESEYAIYPYDPPFSGLNASGAPRIWREGIFYITTKGIYDEVGDYYTQNAYRFKHTGSYLIIDFYVKVNDGAGMFVRVEEFATPAGVTTFEPMGKGFVNNAAEPYATFKIDLGKPTKKERKFYIKIKGNSQGSANSQFGIRFTKMALDD